jgi:hypothetical protein
MINSGAAERLGELAGVRRTRNGRLAVDWLSRRQVPRWRLVVLDGDWYARNGIRRRAAARPAVPKTGRRLTDAERADLADANPWRLWR